MHLNNKEYLNFDLNIIQWITYNFMEMDLIDTKYNVN